QLAPPPDPADGALHRAGDDPDRLHGVLGADGGRDHGRPARRDPPHARVPADPLPRGVRPRAGVRRALDARRRSAPSADRKSTRLNSSHVKISYAVFCLKKKNNKRMTTNAEKSNIDKD